MEKKVFSSIHRIRFGTQATTNDQTLLSDRVVVPVLKTSIQEANPFLSTLPNIKGIEHNNIPPNNISPQAVAYFPVKLYSETRVVYSMDSFKARLLIRVEMHSMVWTWMRTTFGLVERGGKKIDKLGGSILNINQNDRSLFSWEIERTWSRIRHKIKLFSKWP